MKSSAVAVRRFWMMLAAMCVLVATHAAADGVYKWTDESGRVHFGSTPPPGKKAERLNTSATNTPVDASSAKPTTWQEQLDLSNQRRQAATEKEAETAKKRQQADQRCQQARYALDSLERGGARYRINDQGEREYLSDSERQAARDAAAERVRTYCN